MTPSRLKANMANEPGLKSTPAATCLLSFSSDLDIIFSCEKSPRADIGSAPRTPNIQPALSPSSSSARERTAPPIHPRRPVSAIGFSSSVEAYEATRKKATPQAKFLGR